MTKREQALIFRIEGALGAIPFPASGLQSSDVKGHVGYSLDMREAIPAIRTIMLTISNPLVNDFDTPENMLRRLENWITKRQKVNWQYPVLSLDIYGDE